MNYLSMITCYKLQLPSYSVQVETVLPCSPIVTLYASILNTYT